MSPRPYTASARVDHVRDLPFARHRLGVGAAAIVHGHDLAVLDLGEAGEMARLDDATRADDADADGCLAHAGILTQDRVERNRRLGRRGGSAVASVIDR